MEWDFGQARSEKGKRGDVRTNTHANKQTNKHTQRYPLPHVPNRKGVKVCVTCEEGGRRVHTEPM